MKFMILQFIKLFSHMWKYKKKKKEIFKTPPEEDKRQPADVSSRSGFYAGIRSTKKERHIL